MVWATAILPKLPNFCSWGAKRAKTGLRPLAFSQGIPWRISRCVNKDAVTYSERAVNVYVNQINFNLCKKVFDKECAPRYKRIIESQIKETRK